MTVALINVFIDNSIHVCNTLGSHPSPHISFSFLPDPSPTLISVSSLFYFVSVVFTVLNSLGLPRASCVDIHYLLESDELSNGNPMHTMTSSSPAARTAKMEPTSQNLPSQLASLECSPVKCLVGDHSILET